MPHIIIKLLPGRTKEQKTRLTAEITSHVTTTLDCDEDAVSVAFEEINQHDWADKVYRPDILGHPENLYKQPGYTL